MKSQVLTLLLLTIGAILFQSTHQYRLRKRELTEYDLTSFIVNTCSADKIDILIQDLCDQTLQSALMGNFPFLTYYCKMIGSGNRYCDDINRHTLADDENIEAKRFTSHRLVRSLDKDKKSNRHGQETVTDIDLKEKMILQMCMTKTDKNSIEIHRFCNKTLKEIQRGRYPEIKRLCKFHLDFNYCRHVLSSSSAFSWPLLEELSSPLSSSSSITPNIYLSSVPLESSKSSDVEPIIDQQGMNKNTNKLSLL
jgi:hypothetical protein